MARLAAQEKLLYYPTPVEEVIHRIATWFSAPLSYRIADPCVGDGEALDELVQAIGQMNVETWGVELSPFRAKDAEDRINVVLPASFYNVKWDPRSVSMIFNNPPYDWSHQIDNKTGRKIRHERLFVNRCTHHLVIGGHQVAIVPRAQLGDEPMARHLAGWYDKIIIRRFPGEEYDRFKQVVIFAVGRKEKYGNPTGAAIKNITAFAQDEYALSIFELEDGDGSIEIPLAPKGKLRFDFVPMSHELLRELAVKVSPLDGPEWTRETYVLPPGAPINPAVPEKIGHISMEISSGEVGVIDFEGMSAKGTITKVAEKVDTPHYNEEGAYTHSSVEETERLETRIAILRGTGDTELITEREKVAEFITENATKIGDVLLKRNTPTYNWQATEREWDVVSRTALGLPPLPGRTERGLFEIQKHLSIAAARVIKSYGQTILNAEMGFGKSPATVGVAELLDAWPVLLVCPGHMLFKWQRTWEQCGDPNDPVVARIINRPVRNGLKWFDTVVRPLVEEHGYRIVGGPIRSQIAPQAQNDPGGRVNFTLKADTDTGDALLIKAMRSKFSFRAKGGMIRPVIAVSNKGLDITIVDRDDYTLADFFADYDAGLLGRKAVAISGIEPAKYAPGINQERKAYRIVRRRVYDEELEARVIKDMAQCPTCGNLHSLEKRVSHFCNAETETGYVLKEDGTRECGGAMFEMSRWRREGLARLVQRKYKFRFKLYVADEIHKMKGGKTDVGAADGRLCTSIRYGLALTGTIFGGNASSIFWLLYRRNPEVRKRYAYTDRNLWIDHYGLWERTWKERTPRSGPRSLVTGIKRWSPRAKEMPGISPAVIRYLLPITLFGKITDLGYTLPPLREHVDVLEMTEWQGQQYKKVDETLLEQAMELLKDEEVADPGGIATWFTTIRFRPMSGFRDEIARYDSKKTGCTEILHSMPAVVDSETPWLPKEEKLAEHVRNNMANGRKTLVFVEQSGTRDIRPRLMEALEALVPGVNVRKLSAGDMTPARREAWIEANAPTMDVLIVNPSLVETGLDLVMFAGLIFYELPLSLYTLWQAMRRVWRLGQKYPVTCTFMVYQGTVEEALLKRMGVKLKAAMLLYGDEAAGAIVETDDSDLQREMIRAALKGVSYSDLAELGGGDDTGIVTGLFSQGDEVEVVVSASPLGSPIAQSPRMPILERAALVIDFEGPAQLSMFGDPVPASSIKRRARRR
jgi:hypothetical protein